MSLQISITINYNIHDGINPLKEALIILKEFDVNKVLNIRFFFIFQK